jgi:hypothetical protein
MIDEDTKTKKSNARGRNRIYSLRFLKLSKTIMQCDILEKKENTGSEKLSMQQHMHD